MNCWHLRLAVQVLQGGGVVVHATEGVWGLACDPQNPAAIRRVLDLKRRPASMGLILIGAGAAQFERELSALSPTERQQVLTSWPGPVTWVVPNSGFSSLITGGRPTVALRVPGHPQARALCGAFGGPLVSTSANLSGRPAARNRFRVLKRLAEMADPDHRGAHLYLLPGETLGRRTASEIRTVTGQRLRG